MGGALNTASATDSYLPSDRGTWLSFKNKGDLVIQVEGDKHLFNQYGVMLVNPWYGRGMVEVWSRSWFRERYTRKNVLFLLKATLGVGRACKLPLGSATEAHS
jgi:ABC-type tungstate transport system permease subunit